MTKIFLLPKISKGTWLNPVDRVLTWNRREFYFFPKVSRRTWLSLSPADLSRPLEPHPHGNFVSLDRLQSPQKELPSKNKQGSPHPRHRATPRKLRVEYFEKFWMWWHWTEIWWSWWWHWLQRRWRSLMILGSVEADDETLMTVLITLIDDTDWWHWFWLSIIPRSVEEDDDTDDAR